MPTAKKTRKKYRPKPVLTNPLGYVLEGFETVKSHSDHMLRLNIRNSTALAALLQGKAVKTDMDALIAMSNMVEALCAQGFGTEHRAISVEGRAALLNIVVRAQAKAKYIATGPEIGALQQLMELHDAQMDVITVKEMDQAIEYVKKGLRKPDVIRLPEVKGVSDAA